MESSFVVSLMRACTRRRASRARQARRSLLCRESSEVVRASTEDAPRCRRRSSMAPQWYSHARLWQPYRLRPAEAPPAKRARLAAAAGLPAGEVLLKVIDS